MSSLRRHVRALERPRPPLLLAELWLGLALVGVTQRLVARLAPVAITPALLRQDAALLGLWALLVPLILGLVRRWPARGPRARRRVVAYAALGASFIVVSNLAIRLPPVSAGDSLGRVLRATVVGVATFGPAALFVFTVMVLLGHRAWAAVEEPEGARTETWPAHVAIREWSRTHLVAPELIDWITADDNNVVVHAGGRTYKGRGRIRDLERQLDPSRFARVHRSAIVRIDGVREVRALGKGDLAVVLSSGKTLRVARGRRAALEGALRRSS